MDELYASTNVKQAATLFLVANATGLLLGGLQNDISTGMTYGIGIGAVLAGLAGIGVFDISD